jgi:hypothetical protein
MDLGVYSLWPGRTLSQPSRRSVDQQSHIVSSNSYKDTEAVVFNPHSFQFSRLVFELTLPVKRALQLN